MILAEKIATLRKKNGWSQEDLAIKLNISRQSVSKWESTASIPDLDKIIALSEIFGVSTDYLLKDEVEISDEIEPGSIDNIELGNKSFRSVSLEEANAYMHLIYQSAKKIAAGVAMCILSPAFLIFLAGLSAYKNVAITEDMAAGIGVTVLLLIVAGAVAIFITNGMKIEKYEYMEKEFLELQYGIAGIVEVKRKNFESTYKSCITVGVMLCIISAVPLMLAVAFKPSGIVYIICIDVLLVLVAFAVFLFVWSGMIYGSYQKLLEEGDYTREKSLRTNKMITSRKYIGVL